MILYGLTGGISSGKSTVAEIFVSLGIPVISADKLTHEAYTLSEVQVEIETRFGTSDRKKLRPIVFSDAEAKSDLEIILHPVIRRLRQEKINHLTAQQHAMAIYDSALVFETGYEKHLKGVITVDCPLDVRLARLQKRDGITLELAKKMVAAQMPDSERNGRSDFIIMNFGSEADLRAKVEFLLPELRKRANLA